MQPLFDSRQLLAFSVLAQTGSFTQTARELQVSQSAISHAIRALENRVGCRLFERNSRQVLLTPAGEQFLHHVGKINHEMAAAHAALQLLRNWGQFQLRIAAPGSVCDLLLPPCLAEIRRQYPNAVVTLTAADRHEALAELLAGRVDLSVVLGTEPDERFEYHPLFEDELSFVTPLDHPWASVHPTDPAAIGSQPLLTYRRQSYTWHLINDYFAADGIQPTVIIECDSYTAIRRMVALGMGVGILARWVAATDLAGDRLTCVPLGPRRLTRRWGTLSLRTKRLSLPQTLFIEHTRRAGLGLLASLHPLAATSP